MGLSIVMTLFETRKWIFSNEQRSRQRKKHRRETCLCRSHRCIPLAGFRENGFAAGQAALKAESKKVEKHVKASEDNQHIFVPLAFDTFGSLAPEAVRFLTRVQHVVHGNFSNPQGQNFVFSRLGFSIQKGMTAQFVVCLPAILM
ncbi:putative exostosin [Helianthus annuus]|nr:putative exostosin [Helianthus annuus]